MKIIPVIDLKDGLVVHAHQGQRDNYQPINSQLCQSANIHQVINAFLKLYEFDTFYIADLNAITGQGHHLELLEQVLLDFSDIIFWIDRGYLSSQDNYRLPKNHLPILGSESYQDENISEMEAYGNNFILSLDFSGSVGLGAKMLFTNPRLWPEHIIIMTLEKVGSQNGPAFQKLNDLAWHHPDKRFIAAGGVRDTADLINLKKAGVHHALIASALHSGTINKVDITNIQAKKYPD
ncbi:MAG: HisA/HisF-related TIM barrel protein [Methylococcales bacterium]|nr:nickel transporter [Methylococcaceae bacterium]